MELIEANENLALIGGVKELELNQPN